VRRERGVTGVGRKKLKGNRGAMGLLECRRKFILLF